MIGETIDSKYRVLSLLGEGGMGAVYEAENLGTGRKVALKVVNDSAVKRPGMVERFLNEAKVVGAVETQHIVQIFDAGKDPASNCPYIAMELLAGEDCNQLIQRVGPLSPDLSLRIAAQACLGLAKAHAAGIIHRDIKPANLYLARRDAGEVIVKILDFGIAKTMSDTQSARMTATGSVLGSPSYMSPEQVKGLKTIDPLTDIWSLGAVMYEMMTGLVPYHRAETIHQLIMAICAEAPPPLQDLAPWVPPEVVGVVDAAMQHDVSKRFRGAVAMQEFIRRMLPGGSWTIHEGMLVPLDARLRTTKAVRRTPATVVLGSVTTGAVVTAAQVTGSMPSPLASDPPPLPRSSIVLPIAAAAAVAILGLGAVGVYKLTRHPEAPSVAAGASSVPAQVQTPSAAIVAPPPPVVPPPPPATVEATAASETLPASSAKLPIAAASNKGAGPKLGPRPKLPAAPGADPLDGARH